MPSDSDQRLEIRLEDPRSREAKWHDPRNLPSPIFGAERAMSPVRWTLLFGQGCVKLCCGAPGAAGTLKEHLTKNQQLKPKCFRPPPRPTPPPHRRPRVVAIKETNHENLISLLIALLLASVPAMRAADAPKQKPNAHLVVLGDLDTKLGCYGDTLAKTPNFDRLAARGMVLGLALVQLSAHAADKKNIVLIAGKQSHGPGAHEHNAGVQLFAKCLRAAVPDLVEGKVHLNAEWPAEEEIKSADTILIYADGFTMHPALQGDHLQQLSAEMKRGCGFMALHWATEVPKNKGEAEFLDWMGGYCDPIWSVNPHWLADFTTLPQHPITSGVHPFSTTDEWYFHMRFRQGMASVKPILTAVPPDSTMSPHAEGPCLLHPCGHRDCPNAFHQDASGRAEIIWAWSWMPEITSTMTRYPVCLSTRSIMFWVSGLVISLDGSLGLRRCPAC